MNVVVIGAGLAGLSAACHLVGAGHEVTIVERESSPGGRGLREWRDGFAFDIGPTVMTMPGLLEDALLAAGSTLAEAVPMRRLDPGYRAKYVDGSEIRVRASSADMKAEIAATCGPREAAAFGRFEDWLGDLYQAEMSQYIDRNFDGPMGLIDDPRAALRIIRLGAFDRLGRTVGRFFDDDRLRRLFTFQALYAGLAPSEALAVYAVITYMDSIQGVWFPDGGMGAIPEGMARAAQAAGVTLRYDTEVQALERSPGGRVVGVRLTDGELLPAQAVVCTLDLPVAYRTLLADIRPPWTVRHGSYSPSAVVWHLGVRGRPPAGTEHHNIHFGSQWEAAFEALIRQRRLMPDPSRMVSVPTLSDPSLAPEGCSTLYVLEPVPNLAGRMDWNQETDRVKERLMAFLSAEGYPTDVVTEEFYGPLDWERMGMHQGTPFALAHTFRQTGPFRPGNLERKVPGLVFAGSGTIPGVGVPMVLISGKLAAQRVRDDLAAGRPERTRAPWRRRRKADEARATEAGPPATGTGRAERSKER